ncbi:MAG: right-handed parallel beta-helix repeat-containing protein [Porticoccaceae bacterium]
MMIESQTFWRCFRTVFVAGIMLVFHSIAICKPIDYFVSSSEGNDKNNGLSENSPWATLKRVKKQKLQPGDTVHFKSGDLFKGQLVVDESGTVEAPIHFTAYGDGDLPIIDGAALVRGASLAAILVIDQDHLEFSKLNIRNFRKKSRDSVSDYDAFGILVKNTGKRNLRGYNLHDLVVEEVFPVRARAINNKSGENSFNKTQVSGIRFETLPITSIDQAFNTGDIYIHGNFLRYTARFGIAIRHRSSKIESIIGTSANYDTNVRIINNRCEDTGGSCVLMSGVMNGLLEKNSFIRSGAMVEPELSVNRGSGAWFFGSKNIVAQKNFSYGSRGHNDSAGMHVDYGNENVLVQYNFTLMNEGYGTEILGKNKNIIWRHNISVHDGTRVVGVARPEGGKSIFPGKTIHVSNFSVPKRIKSEGVYIYNNTYVIASDSEPLIGFIGKDMHLWNNIFVVEDGGLLAKNLKAGWSRKKDLEIRGNVFSGNISKNFIDSDLSSTISKIKFEGNIGSPATYAVAPSAIKSNHDLKISHPRFPSAGKGIFKHISEIPQFDIFGNALDSEIASYGAGY